MSAFTLPTSDMLLSHLLLVGTWGAWAGCSKTCGRDGKKERTRAWTGAGVAHLELKQIQNCYAPPCSGEKYLNNIIFI